MRVHIIKLEAQENDEKREEKLENYYVELRGEVKSKKKPPSDMYKARPFDLTRYAVPNERCQSRLH